MSASSVDAIDLPWCVRKESELRYLCAASGIAVPTGELTLDRVIETKQRCRAALQAALPSVATSQTNSTGNPHFEVNGHPLESLYQRSDLRVVYPEPFTAIYRSRLPEGAVAVGNYSANGMASITGVFFALERLGRPPVLRIRPDAYFETLRLLREYFPRIEIQKDGEAPASDRCRVLWIDTVEVDPFAKPPCAGEADIVVIDTTCVALTDERLRRYIEQTLEARIPLVLVRSHLKLDSLGMEYGRLGSTVFVTTVEAGIESARFFAGLMTAYSKAVYLSGLNFDPRNLLSLHLDDRFHRLNDRRIRVIRRNTRLLADVLEGAADLAVQRYAHDLFVTVKRRAGPELDGRPLGAWLAARDLPARASTSFGLERLGVDTYLGADGDVTVRLSVPDLDPDVIVLLARSIIEFSSNAGSQAA